MKTPQSRPLQSPLTYLCYYATQKFSVLSLQTLCFKQVDISKITLSTSLP